MNVIPQILKQNLEGVEPLYYAHVIGSEFYYPQIRQEICTKLETFLLFGLSKTNNENESRKFMNVAEQLVLHAPVAFKVNGFRWYLQTMNTVPNEYIRACFNQHRELIELLPELANFYGTFYNVGVRPDVAFQAQERLNINREERFTIREERLRIDTGSQSVHGTQVTTFVQKTLDQLFKENEYSNYDMKQFLAYVQDYKSSIHDRPAIGFFSKLKRYICKKLSIQASVSNDITRALNRITIDTTSFLVYGRSITVKLFQVFCKVYSIIKAEQKKDIQQEMLARLDQELTEMAGQCSVGHINRLVNVLNGFISLNVVSEDAIYRDVLFRVQNALEKDKEFKTIAEFIGDPEHKDDFKPFVQKYESLWSQQLSKEYNTDCSKMVTSSLQKIGIC